ncbi:CatB-related O-acetyltransferase [Amphritea sp. RP18W]|uniref:CatB-related O-acetyltransferase n=2 Tax=Amphritea pacifica TaxID=2811233 RepID=A0ABS2WCZ4_9GAMM|nr:CatB-related O-acetyltransferase [Amphritea pacifica]
MLKHRKKRLVINGSSKIALAEFGFANVVHDGVSLYNVRLGDYSYVSYNTVLINSHVGKYCSIGPGCRIGLGKHPLNYVSTHPAFFSKSSTILQPALCNENESPQFEEFENIQIGNDVWIGASVIIVDGITIGDGAVIGAGSVVTKNVADYDVVAGVPAKRIKRRFSEDTIAKIKETEWWDFSFSELKKSAATFRDVDDFIVKYPK